MANLTAKPVNLPKFMLVATSSNALTYTIQARYDELHISTDEGLIHTQCDKVSSDSTIIALSYKMAERCNE